MTSRTNDVLVAGWLEALVAERGTVSSSIGTYRTTIRCWMDFLAGRDLDILTASRADFSAYLHHLDNQHFADATVALRRAAVRSLYRYLIAEEEASSDPTDRVAPMKRSERPPIILGEKEVDVLLETAHAMAKDKTVGVYRQAGYARRAALFEVLYATGLRISEAVSLPANAIGANASHMYVVGRGGKERIVPFHNRAIDAVAFWRQLARAYGTVSDKWLFHSVRNGERHLTRQTALDEIKEAAIASGISDPDRVSPHKLRHAFASHLLSNGMDLLMVHDMLGNSDLGLTEIYLDMPSTRKDAIMRDLHPLNDQETP